MTMNSLLLLLASALLAPVYSQGNQGDSAYTNRQIELQGLVLNKGGVHNTTIQSCLDLPVDQDELAKLLLDLDTERDAAFDIVILIRLLLCGNKALNPSSAEQDILDSLAPLPFWIGKGEEKRVYWTENQQIMWMSSEFLLQQEYPNLKEYSNTLRQRLVHYLNMKLSYGFAEFFSSVYFPFTLSGLLNLVDFCTDTQIQSLAVQVTEKLLSLILVASNNEGRFIAASGRNYVNYYLGEPAIHGVIWMLRGAGKFPEYTHQATSFLSTSTLNVSSVISSYQPTFVGNIYVGPSIEDSFGFNNELDRVDRTMFQWSMGGYFHPRFSGDTQWVLQALDLWGHGEFDDFTAFDSLPDWIGNAGADLLSTVTASSVLCGFDISIFRHGSSILSSAQDFWPGHMGYQSWPWIATTGNLSIWTQSGKTEDTSWSDRPDTPSNTHLPRVLQNENVGLIMYNRNDDITLLSRVTPDSPLSVDDFEVALHWPSQSFSQDLEIGQWKIGVEGNSYVAVACHCKDTINDIVACTSEHQTWAVIVGNAEMYGSLDDFVSKVEEATFEHQDGWSWLRRVFRGKIVFDGITIEHSW